MTVIEPTTRPMSREEYYQGAAMGWYNGERVERIAGEVYVMPAMGHLQVKAVVRLRACLDRIYSHGYWVREEKPLAVGEGSDPQPDLAVVQGDPDSFSDHPTTAILVVEVADTSLKHDRGKAGLYASAGVGEYWILNLVERQLEVYRQVEPDASDKFGHRYAQERILGEAQSVAPPGYPQHRIQIADLLA